MFSLQKKTRKRLRVALNQSTKQTKGNIMSVRTLPAKELKRFIGFYEQTLIELMSYFEKKEISFKSLACYRDYTKYRFLFELLYVGYNYKLQLDYIESKVMGETSHVKLQYWFEEHKYWSAHITHPGFVEEKHVIVEKNYFDDIEQFSNNYR